MALIKIRLNEAIDGEVTTHEFNTIEQLKRFAESGGKSSTKSSKKSGEKSVEDN
jgi:hypothetical protein